MAEDRALAARLERLANQVRSAFARGVTSLVADGLKMQGMQIRLLDGETVDNVERAQQYGFTSVPHAGSECFVAFIGAGREHGIILAVDDRRYRLTGLEGGEVALYTDEGDKIVLKRERHMELTTKHLVIKAEDDVSIETKSYTVSASQGVTYNTPSYTLGGGEGCQANISANMALDGTLQSTGDQVAGGVSQMGHTHEGVQSGGDTTGKPVGGA